MEPPAAGVLMRLLPVTIIGGFLGAGKTTLLNRLLAAADGERIAVLVNDFGAVNIDEHLIASRDATVLTLTNGCVCCSLQSDLVSQVAAIARQDGPPFDQLVIETSGVSDPGPVVRALGYPRLRDCITVSGVATVIDVLQYRQLSGAARELAETQLLAADIAIISKSELSDPAAVDDLRTECRSLGIRSIAALETRALAELLFDGHARAARAAATFTPAGARPPAFEHWSLRACGTLRPAALRAVLESLPDEVCRVKGFAKLEGYEDSLATVQVVGSRVDIRRTAADSGATGDVLVFIGVDGRVDWIDIEKRVRGCLVAH
jgi:G3E family GTPase